MEMTAPLSFFLILISPAVGSFLAVLADRLPRGEDILIAPSRCRDCGTRLGARDLIPIASYLMRRGVCSHCGGTIPAFTLYAEMLALGAGVLAVLAGGGNAEIALSALWLWLLIALGTTDLLWFRLPDPLVAALLATALALAALPGGIGIELALWGAALGIGSFALLRWGYAALRGREGLGLGDVKLMAGLGAFAGPFDLAYLVLLAALSALLVAVLTRDRATDGLSLSRALPFGTALCAAAALLWFLRAAF